jgi:cytoskeletal protein CcmA (bactofilin family)
MQEHPEGMTVIGEDVEIVGSVKCTSNIQIDGKLTGDLTCNGKAVVGGSAAIKGNLNVDAATLQGQLNGNVTAKDIIQLKATARMTGDLRAKRLTVEDGVTFVGKAEINPSGAAQARPAAAPEKPAEGEDESEDEQGGNEKARAGLFGKR